MSSPSRPTSPKSDSELATRLQALKDQLEAETKAADAKKAQKEQERKERIERCVVEDRDRVVHARVQIAEEAKQLARELRGVWRAVAAVAREMAEPESTQSKRERGAYLQVWASGEATEGDVGSGEEPSNAESEEGSEEVDQEVPSQRLFPWPVVRSCHNTAEVIIV